MENYFANDPQYVKNTELSKEEKNTAVLMHLSILSGLIVPVAGLIVPVIIWALKRSESPYIDEQGKEIINFMINIIIAGIFVALLSLILIGFLLMIPYVLYVIIVPIIAAVKCSDGAYYKYPFIFRFIK